MDGPTVITQKKINVGMRFIKYLMIFINVLYLIISFLMISGATTLKVIFGEYYFILWYSATIDSLSSLWISTGCFLLVLSIFGIAAALKQSTMMTNFYGVFLSLIFILQMAAAITGFALITQSSGIVWQSLHELMNRFENYYGYYHERETMNWVQKTFECCGNEGPSDWQNYGFGTTTSYPYYYDRTETPTEYSTTKDNLDRMPESCCRPGSAYDSNSKVCEYHYTRGCHGPLHEIVSQSVMMIGSSALIIGVVQILGIICAFMFARTIRRNKTHRNIQRWGVPQSMGFDRPAYVDNLPTPESHTDEVKHI